MWINYLKGEFSVEVIMAYNENLFNKVAYTA